MNNTERYQEYIQKKLGTFARRKEKYKIDKDLDTNLINLDLFS